MKEITFVPRNFIAGNSYSAQLYLNGSGLVGTITNLIENNTYEFQVTTPGTYTLVVFNETLNECSRQYTINAFYPITTYTVSDVDCNTDNYNFNITLQNPATAGAGIQYGWSLSTDCNTVTNWSSSSPVILRADSVERYVFVRNNAANCCYLIASSSAEPCINCDLTVTNINFSCGTT